MLEFFCALQEEMLRLGQALRGLVSPYKAKDNPESSSGEGMKLALQGLI